MLDHPLVADPKLDSSQTTHSGDVGEAVRHLSHGELEAYVEGRLAPGQLEHCSTHLESCLACRADLEDLRALKTASLGLARPQPSLGRELERRRKRRLVKAAQATAVVVIFATGVSIALWWERDRLLPKSTPLAANVNPGTASPVTITRTLRAQSTEQAVAPIRKVTPTSLTAKAVPTFVTAKAVPMPTSITATEPDKAFELIGPFGDPIAETRPEFQWTPLTGAVRYSVAIVDERLHPVQHSRGLRKTSWRPRRPLRHGHAYLWQVTATLRGGSTVVASGPDPSGALLRISPK